jgi:hypothetical protein
VSKGGGIGLGHHPTKNRQREREVSCLDKAIELGAYIIKWVSQDVAPARRGTNAPPFEMVAGPIQCLGRQSIDGWRLRPAAMHVMRCCHGASRGEPDVFRPLDVIVEGSSMPVDGEVKVWVVPCRFHAMVGEEKASGPWDRSECGHLHMATRKGPVSCGPACLTGRRCGPWSIKQ